MVKVKVANKNKPSSRRFLWLVAFFSSVPRFVLAPVGGGFDLKVVGFYTLHVHNMNLVNGNVLMSTQLTNLVTVARLNHYILLLFLTYIYCQRVCESSKRNDSRLVLLDKSSAVCGIMFPKAFI